MDCCSLEYIFCKKKKIAPKPFWSHRNSMSKQLHFCLRGEGCLLQQYNIAENLQIPQIIAYKVDFLVSWQHCFLNGCRGIPTTGEVSISTCDIRPREKSGRLSCTPGRSSNTYLLKRTKSKLFLFSRPM